MCVSLILYAPVFFVSVRCRIQQRQKSEQDITNDSSCRARLPLSSLASNKNRGIHRKEEKSEIVPKLRNLSFPKALTIATHFFHFLLYTACDIAFHYAMCICSLSILSL